MKFIDVQFGQNFVATLPKGGTNTNLVLTRQVVSAQNPNPRDLTRISAKVLKLRVKAYCIVTVPFPV